MDLSRATVSDDIGTPTACSVESKDFHLYMLELITAALVSMKNRWNLSRR